MYSLMNYSHCHSLVLTAFSVFKDRLKTKESIRQWGCELEIVLYSECCPLLKFHHTFFNNLYFFPVVQTLVVPYKYTFMQLLEMCIFH